MPIVTAEGAPRRPPATRTFGEAAHQCGPNQWPTELGSVEVILIAADLAPTSEGRTQGDGSTAEDGVLGAAFPKAYRLAPIQNASRKPEWTFPVGRGIVCRRLSDEARYKLQTQRRQKESRQGNISCQVAT